MTNTTSAAADYVARSRQRRVLTIQAEVGQTLLHLDSRKYHRVDQLSSLLGRAFVTPVRYSDEQGIVRAGHSFWTTLRHCDWQTP